jgi:NAD-dependent dihydropyrimidine dehydrogenase PreA subunit
MPQVVLDAGLGEVSRMGIILNPFLGCNFKSACVLTNMELETDGYVDFGLQEYCGRCTLCAEQCPARAITKGPKTLYNGYYTWKLNSKLCSDFDVLNKEGCVCGRCTKVCPWHVPGSEPGDFAEWDGSAEWLEARADAQRERVVASNYVDPTEATDKWWFPLDEVDGKLVLHDEEQAEDLSSTRCRGSGRDCEYEACCASARPRPTSIGPFRHEAGDHRVEDGLVCRPVRCRGLSGQLILGITVEKEVEGGGGRCVLLGEAVRDLVPFTPATVVSERADDLHAVVLALRCENRLISPLSCG